MASMEVSSGDGDRIEDSDAATAAKVSTSHFEKSTEELVEVQQLKTIHHEEGNKVKSILCALTVCLGSFAFGTTIGWPSPAMPNLNAYRNPFHVSDEQNSWVGSIVTLGALAGGLVGGTYMDLVGRKLGLLYCAFPFAVGWVIIVSSGTFGCLLAGRAVTGVCTGIFSVICPVYIAEISPPSIRGLLGSCHQLAICIGILFTYGFGAFLPWTWLTISCEAFIIVMTLAMVFIPESPRWLLANGREEETKFALHWLRGEDADITAELEELREAIRLAQDKASFRDFLQPQLWKPLAISLGLMLFQQFSGINVIMFYTVQIFDMANIDLDPNMQTIIVGAVGVVGTLVSVFIADLAGRKILLVTSAAIMALSIGGLGAFFYEQYWFKAYAQSTLSWLPVTCLVVFNFGFDMAFGPIPWLMMGELFPLRAKGIATSVASAFNWLCAFLVTKFFVNMTAGMTVQGAYWFFTGFCALAIPFIIFLVPETKGITLEEIEHYFR